MRTCTRKEEKPSILLAGPGEKAIAPNDGMSKHSRKAFISHRRDNTLIVLPGSLLAQCQILPADIVSLQIATS